VKRILPLKLCIFSACFTSKIQLLFALKASLSDSYWDKNSPQEQTIINSYVSWNRAVVRLVTGWTPKLIFIVILIKPGFNEQGSKKGQARKGVETTGNCLPQYSLPSSDHLRS